MCAVPVSGELPRPGQALPGALNTGPEGFPRLPWNEGPKGKRGRASQAAPWPGASLSGKGKSCAPVSTVESAVSRGLLPSSLEGRAASEWVPAGRGGVRALQLSPAPGSLAWPRATQELHQPELPPSSTLAHDSEEDPGPGTPTQGRADAFVG